MKYGFFAAIFISACIFAPFSSSASPFVDYGTGGKASREGGLGGITPPYRTFNVTASA
jgi:hypothetical protein